jgi:hypothetical protein
MSKPKKKPQKGSGIKLTDAILQYNVKNYTGALKRLKVAELKPGEEQKAKSLRYALTLRLAFAEMSTHNYTQAIEQLQSLLPDDPTAAALGGISYLYLSEYESAIPLLKTAVQTYPAFAFYHLLGEIYVQKDIDFKGFTNHFKQEWAQCSDSQKQYIQIIICVFNNQLAEATTIVENMKNESHFQHLNFEAFKNVFSIAKSKESLSDKVKPLYRLLLNGFVSDAELAYFSHLNQKTGELSALLDHKSTLSAPLQKEIAAQYNDQKVLGEGTLSQIMQALPAEERPYIVYNQAVNAYHQSDFAVADRGIKHVIVKYVDDFVLVPESLSLYLNFYQNEDFRMYPNTFWSFIKKWLSVRSGYITVDNLDAMGWQIFDIMFKHAPAITFPYNSEPQKILNDTPSVFALKYAQILFPFMQVPANLVTDNRLDLFSLPNSEKNKTLFIEKFDTIVSVLSPYNGNNRFRFLDDGSLSVKEFSQQIAYFGDCFIKAVTDYPVPTQNLIALEGFKMVHKYVKIIFEKNENTLPTGFYARFTATYKQLLAKFPQNETTKAYKLDLESVEYAPYLVKLSELTRYKTSLNQFNIFLKTVPKTLDCTFMWEHFCQRIKDVHFSESMVESFCNFLEAFFAYRKDETASKNEIDTFIVVYKKLAEEADCEHPTMFYAQMIRILLKNKKISKNIIYFFCVQYIAELTLSYELEQQQYNAVAEFLNWILSNNYNLAYPADKQLFVILRNYLIRVNQTKQLKGLGKTILNTATYV